MANKLRRGCKMMLATMAMVAISITGFTGGAASAKINPEKGLAKVAEQKKVTKGVPKARINSQKELRRR